MAETQSALSIARVLKVIVPVAAIGGLLYWWSSTLEATARKEVASNVITRMFAAENAPVVSKLNFPDADDDMVADSPIEAGQTIDPDVLVFSFIATIDEDGPPDETWNELFAAVKEKTGKDVKLVHFLDVTEQLAAMNKGELHISGLNTGLVPVAVDREGFVPLCTLGREDGTFGYTMEILVPAGSPIKDLAQVKGRKVTFTRPDSNSGCKAALVLLKEQYNLLPERDYQWGFSLGHEDSIIALLKNEAEIAPVASDVLARIAKMGEIDTTKLVSIYTSERFPPVTFGYVYNLSPELREGIREVFLNFDWSGTGLEKEFGPETTKFVPVNYKDDWANTRRIDRVIFQAQHAGVGGM